MKNVLPNKIPFISGYLLSEKLGMALMVLTNSTVQRGEYMIMHKKDFDYSIKELEWLEKMVDSFQPTDA